MYKRGSKITTLMLAIVFCAFVFAGCGNTNDNTTGDTTDKTTTEEQSTTDQSTNKDQDTVTINITSPAEGDTLEGGTLKVEGTAEGTPNPGKDKVTIELTTEDGEKLGEETSLVADLDNAYSADLKYEITDKMKKNDDQTVNARLCVYLNGDNDTALGEKTISIKVK